LKRKEVKITEQSKDQTREHSPNSPKKEGSIMSSDEKQKKGMTRRDFFKGAAVAGAAVASAGALNNYAQAGGHHDKGWGHGGGHGGGHEWGPEWEDKGLSLSDLPKYGEDLESMLLLRSSPIGIKMLRSESQVPEGARRPGKEQPGDIIGGRLSLCQAFALARRGIPNPGWPTKAIAMFAEDHRCFEPVIAFGLKPPNASGAPDYLGGMTTYPGLIADLEAAAKHAQDDPRLPYELFEGSGMVFGPLKAINFVPDLVMIYCNTGQLRHLTLALGYKHAYMVNSSFYGIGSCGRAAVPPLLTGEATITVPDPGEYDRAGTTEDIMILTLPARKRNGTNLFQDMMEGLRTLNAFMSYTSFDLEVRSDHPQPGFYKAFFNAWGLGD
jgi:uncharacterized protein (DUF169 family)